MSPLSSFYQTFVDKWLESQIEGIQENYPSVPISLPYVEGTTDKLFRLIRKANIRTFFAKRKTIIIENDSH